MRPINAVNWRDRAAASSADKRSFVCKIVETGAFMLMHWDSDDQGLVFFPPWHHQHHGCLRCVITALLLDKLLGQHGRSQPFCLPQSREKRRAYLTCQNVLATDL